LPRLRAAAALVARGEDAAARPPRPGAAVPDRRPPRMTRTRPIELDPHRVRVEVVEEPTAGPPATVPPAAPPPRARWPLRLLLGGGGLFLLGLLGLEAVRYIEGLFAWSP